MSIDEFIQREVLLPRLRERGVLVVYDPERRYQALCLALAGSRRAVVDASESSIESREVALAALQSLGDPASALEGLLVYVPAAPPQSDDDRQRDPFALYEACGRRFPESDGDAYEALCLRAKADHATEIRRIFRVNPSPSFETIDAVGSGGGWPQLQTILRVESARDLLLALLAPSDDQRAALDAQESWVDEAMALCASALGLGLLTRARRWEPLAEELWRYLLYSEFALDLTEELPPALRDVPRAQPDAQLLVRDLCERLRNDRRSEGLYVDRAGQVARELNLAAVCGELESLERGSTFAFQDRRALARAVDALLGDHLDAVREATRQHDASIWARHGENHVQWALLGSASALVRSCQDAERALPEHVRSQHALIDHYAGSLREVDRYQREFEQAAADCLDSDTTSILQRARRTYRRLADSVQTVFLRHLDASGWPPTGRLANADLFERLVTPCLRDAGYKVALLLIDALRYELGVELCKELAGEGQAEVQAACAQLPTITAVGMASLLPSAGADLRLVERDGRVSVQLGDQHLATVMQRMDLLRRTYGQRFAEAPLLEFARGRTTPDPAVDLLVLRSNEMDGDFESNPEAAPGLITRTLQQVDAAVRRLGELGYREAIIATDHGFYLNGSTDPGDVCIRPSGTWVSCHDRLLLGDGTADSANQVLCAEALGIRGPYRQVAVPRAMVAYRAGQYYMHGGVSLQEAIVPVITVRLRVAQQASAQRPTVSLSYRRGSGRITTRVPAFEVRADAADLFSQDETIEILVEAHDLRGHVVGEARLGGPVSPATRLVSLKPGESIQVSVKMLDDFDGPFVVKALDPVTMATYDTVDLETDYVV